MTAYDITPRAPIGSLLKSDKPKKQPRFDMGRSPRRHDDGHLEAIRQCPCLACGRDPCGEAAHVRYSTPRRPNPGLQCKPHDRECVPLCRPCHTEQHSGDERTFWAARNIDPLKVAAELAKYSPDTEAMRAVVFVIRAAVNLGRDAL